MKNVFSILAICLLASCASTPPQKSKIPKESIGSAGVVLGADIVSSINSYIINNYSCSSWKAISVNTVSVNGDLYFTEVGQIHTGSIAENWSVDYCGSSVILGLVIAPDGAGGSLIAITKL